MCNKILIFIIILFFILNYKNKNNKEFFIESNFALCKTNDCRCLKMNKAPDGTCVLYKIKHRPLIPEYKNKKFYKPFVVKSDKYPLKKKEYTLIFIGSKIKNTKNERIYAPKLLKFMYKENEEMIYSKDKLTQYYLDVFFNVLDILKPFGKKDEPFLKYMILDVNKKGYEDMIFKSYNIKKTKEPSIILFNQKNNYIKEFKIDDRIKRNRCMILQELIIFISNYDCGLISYINHIHDPFLGVKFKHNSKKNIWEINDKGERVKSEGTTMCKLIDYKDLPNDFKCK